MLRNKIKLVSVARHGIVTQQWQPSDCAGKVELLGKLRTIFEDFRGSWTMFEGLLNSKQSELRVLKSGNNRDYKSKYWMSLKDKTEYSVW